MKPFFDSSKKVAALKLAFSGWTGTPFRDHWREKLKGVDCVQLAVAIYSEVGVSGLVDFPQYKIGSWQGLKSSPIIEWLSSSKSFTRIFAEAPKIGDLLCFAQGRVAYHLGVCIDEDAKLFCHAITGEGVCIGNLSDPTWHKRHVATYRPVNV